MDKLREAIEKLIADHKEVGDKALKAYADERDLVKSTAYMTCYLCAEGTAITLRKALRETEE
jgi:hypothetical protein